MSRLNIRVDDIPIPLPSRKNASRKKIYQGIAEFGLAFVVVVIVATGLNPALAESVVSLVRSEEAVLEMKKERQAAIDEGEVLWLARALYSESKYPGEQRLVAWVVRNRVESSRYANTYQGVVREANQFSGLHPQDEQYAINTTLTRDDTARGWDTALAIAEEVYRADGTQRLIAQDVMHFYSPISARRTPTWAHGEDPYRLVRDPHTGAIRFAFYNGIR